jgi:hypothetical protein
MSSLVGLPITLELPISSTPSLPLGSCVRRLDLELIDDEFGPDHPRNQEPLTGSHLGSIVRILTQLPNLKTILLLLPGCNGPKELMDAVPSTIQRFYWKAGGKTPMSIARILAFLDAHPAITSVAFPEFSSSGDGHISHEWNEDWKVTRRPLIQDWVLREDNHSFSVSYLSCKGILPGLSSRSVAFLVDRPQPGHPDWDSHEFSLAVSPQAAPNGNGGIMTDTIHPNTSITRISVLEPYEGSWPTQSFCKKLEVLRRQCLSVQDLHVTLIGNETSNDQRAESSDLEAPQVTAVTSLSILRISNEWPVPDPLDSLHRILRIPWNRTFPRLQTIRVMEEVDLDISRHHPSLAFARAQGWTIRIEDRFGEALV